MAGGDRFFVITGGPGAGKTTLIDALAATGLAVTREAGRAVIREEMARDGGALPWCNAEAFAQRMLKAEIASYREARRRPGPVVFDRGVPDIVGYRRLAGLTVPDALLRLARRLRYAPHVFLAPYWPAIFGQDSERKQSPDEAAATCAMMDATYRNLGYALVPLPLGSVDDRVAFVRARIGV